MIEILAKVDRSLLLREVLRVPLASSVGIDQSAQTREHLAAFLVAYYDGDLFARETIRHCLLTIFPLEYLNEASRSFGLPESTFAYDAALILATLGWSPDSPLPALLQKMLAEKFNFRLPAELLPGTKVDRPPTVEDIPSDPAPPLFEYQQQVSEQVSKVLSTAGARAMVQMPTGAGKTRTVMDALVRMLRTRGDSGPILWLAHSEELCEQAIVTFKRCWVDGGVGTARVCRLWGDHSPSPEQIRAGLVIAGLQKLVSLKKKSTPLYHRLASSCQIIVFDEAHKALAPTYQELLADLSSSVPGIQILGITATPGRSVFDVAENRELALLFHNNLISPNFGNENPISALRKQGILANIKRIAIKSPTAFRLTESELAFLDEFFEFPPSILARLSQDTQRNLLIVATVVEQVKRGLSTIVFACGVEHSKLIAALATLKGALAASITSDMSPASRGRCIARFRTGEYQAIVNYGILSTGFDAPNAGAIVIARPTASIVLYSQMIGRGMRGPRVGGGEECVVVDIVDNIDGFGQEEKVYKFFAEYWQDSHLTSSGQFAP